MICGVTFNVGFNLSALLTTFLCIYEKVAKLGVTSIGVCYMLVGLPICRKVIFQVIKEDFFTGISLAITQVLCMTIILRVIDQALAKLKSSR